MLKKLCVLVGVFVSFSSAAKEVEEQTSDKKSGYNYVIKNYFSKRRANTYHNSKSFSLFTGTTIYRESQKKAFKAFSSLTIAYNQNLKQVSRLGDLNLNVALFSSEMQKQNAVLLELAPRFTLPTIQSGFPLYVGLGLGFGFYPRYIIKKKPALSLSGQFFTGLRFFNIYHNIGLIAELNLRIHTPLNELDIYLETLAQLALVFRY